MADLLEWRRVSPNDVIVHTIQQLDAGSLVVLPTDTSYVACAYALHPDAVQRLAGLQPISERNNRLHLAVTGVGELLDWVPSLSLPIQRLARRSWPGPLTLAFSIDLDQSIAQQLAIDVRYLLLTDDRLFARCPAHEAILHVLNYLPGPLLFRPLLDDDHSEIVTQEGLEPLMYHEEIATWIVDGNTHFGINATIAEGDGENWSVVQPGAVSEEELQKRTGCQIIFVCTGNTCRSPMAEALCKKLLAEQLECQPENLAEHGFEVLSAGIAAGVGGQASPEAVETVKELGADLSNHQSRPLTANMLMASDHVLTMTASHLQALSGHGINMSQPPRLLSLDGEDVADPIGSEREVYRTCAQQILEYLKRRLPEFQQP